MGQFDAMPPIGPRLQGRAGLRIAGHGDWQSTVAEIAWKQAGVRMGTDPEEVVLTRSIRITDPDPAGPFGTKSTPDHFYLRAGETLARGLKRGWGHFRPRRGGDSDVLNRLQVSEPVVRKRKKRKKRKGISLRRADQLLRETVRPVFKPTKVKGSRGRMKAGPPKLVGLRSAKTGRFVSLR